MSDYIEHPPETIQYVFSVLFHVYCNHDPRYILELKSPPSYVQSHGQVKRYLLLQVWDNEQNLYVFDLFSTGEWRIAQNHPFEDYFRKLVQQMERMLTVPSTNSPNGVPIPLSRDDSRNSESKKLIIKTRYKPLYGNSLKLSFVIPESLSDRPCMVCGNHDTIIVFDDVDPDAVDKRIMEIFCPICCCYSTFIE